MISLQLYTMAPQSLRTSTSLSQTSRPRRRRGLMLLRSCMFLLSLGDNALSNLSTPRDDAAKVAQDITTLVDDISTLAKAVKPKSGGESPKPAPAPKIPGFPFL